MDVTEDFVVPGHVSGEKCTGQGNKFDLIPTVTMETRHPVQGSFGNKFSSIYNRCGLKSQNFEKKLHFLHFLEK